MYMCDPPESTPPSQNIPPFNKCILCATLQEYTSPSLNIPPFSTTICDPPRIYPSLSEYTPPLFNKCICATLPEYTPPSLPEYTPLFNTFQQLNATFPESTPLSTAIILCDAPRIYPSLPEYTPPPFQQLYMTLPESTPPSQNIPTFQQLFYYTTLPESIPPSISPRIYPPLSTTRGSICDTHRNYPSLREYHPFLHNYMPPSLSEYIPPHLSKTICDIPRI